MNHSLRYDLNCSTLFTGLPVLERAAAAKAVGFDAVEFWWPFPVAVPSDADTDAFVRSIRNAGVALAALNFFAGDLSAGERGLVSWPERSVEFRDNVDIVIGIGEQLGCRAFNALYGNRLDWVAPERQDDVAVGNLAAAARSAARIDGTILVEAVSGLQPYPLRTAADAVAVVDSLRRETATVNVAFLADFYHLHVNGDDLDQVVEAHANRIGHVQIADAPGKHEPGTGALDLGGPLHRLEQAGYTGYVGLEYIASDPLTPDFGWLPRERRGARQDAPAATGEELR